MPHLAMGMIETRGLVAAIEAADAAAKTAEVHMLRKERVGGGLIMIRFIGETSAVQAATQAAALAAARVGEMVATHVIARLDVETAAMLGVPTGAQPPHPAPEPAADATIPEEPALQHMSTVQLRDLARNLPDFPISGRELNRTPKQQLIEALVRLMTQGKGHE